MNEKMYDYRVRRVGETEERTFSYLQHEMINILLRGGKGVNIRFSDYLANKVPANHYIEYDGHIFEFVGESKH